MHNAPLAPATPGALPLDDLPPEEDALVAVAPHVESFGERVARLRRIAALTQADLAQRLGVSMTAVCYWEQDRSQPKRARLHALASALEVGLSTLTEPARAPAPQDFQHLVARARIEIAKAAGIAPEKVKIVIEV